MAYTPDSATQAALAKSRTGAKLTPAEQSLLTQHSQRMIADMAPTQVTGGGGSYDYGSGSTGGYAGYGSGQSTAGVGSNQVIGPDGKPYYTADNAATSYDKYQNFIRTETERRQQGLPPRPLPSMFTQFLSSQNPLGYSGNGDTMPVKQSPVVDSMGVASEAANNAVHSQPVLPTTPFNGYTSGASVPPMAPNPGVTAAPPVANGSTPSMVAPLNTADGTPSAPQTIHTSNGGLALGNSVAGTDEGKLLAEAELQKQLAGQTNDAQAASRAKLLEDLSTTLQKQQAGAMNDMMPGVYEDLNSRGLLRSSALGEKVGLEASKLSRQTSEQLALQGITDSGKTVDNMGTIEDAYLGARGTALQRRFSLEDFDRQVAAGKELGANALPQISQSSGKGAGALQGGLGGATIGAQVGGPTGAAVGGAIGLIGGGKLGSK